MQLCTYVATADLLFMSCFSQCRRIINGKYSKVEKLKSIQRIWITKREFIFSVYNTLNLFILKKTTLLDLEL